MADKPLDVGSGAICASFATETAGLLSLGAPHPVHGFVELSAVPPFDERERGDPAATRRHRLRLTDAAFAVLAPEHAPPLVADTADPARPRWTGPGTAVEAWTDLDSTTIRQRWRTDRPLRLVLRGSLDRPALAEITELDPPRPTGAVTEITLDGASARIDAPRLPATATVKLVGMPATWMRDADGAIADLPAGEFEVWATLGEARDGVAGTAVRPDADPLVTRALAYVRGCTALRIGRDERVILTDHRLLPLSWTRDAYYQALLLLAADGPGDRERVADHLRWLWRRCERPDHRWVRSHHADGRRKDLAFQADQQLYPIIELADYWRMTGSLPEGVDWPVAVRGAWAAALEEVDPALGLMATAENAADDPIPAPFVAASQVLLWYAAQRLIELTAAVPLRLDHAAVRATADAVHRAFDAWFEAPGGAWPYAIDGTAVRVAYHDANDLPVALAPVWGFCTPDDPGWRATMDFAFSSANPGWFDGMRPGLGSVHTPGPWTLGDLQAWLVGQVTGDAASVANARQRLAEVAFADGMLPEAYGADGEEPVRIRPWFAWPGAAAAAFRLLERERHIDRIAATASR